MSRGSRGKQAAVLERDADTDAEGTSIDLALDGEPETSDGADALEVAVPSLDHLTGAQKAAIVLLRLGKERSARVLKQLGEQEVTQVTAEIVRARGIRREEANASLVEFAAMVRA